MTLDPIRKAVDDATRAALMTGGRVVETRAKQLAPVRNIFGRHYTFRLKTAAEFSRDLRFVDTASIESMLETGNVGNFDTTATGKRPPRDWKERRLAALEGHLEDYENNYVRPRLGKGPEPVSLTRYGAYEVRTQRAAFSTWGHTHIGGRLRGEIFTTRKGDEVWVISPTPYGRYQEFGTRHNRAHPFLRPAAEESRGTIVRMIGDAVGAAAQKGGVHTEVDITVRI